MILVNVVDEEFVADVVSRITAALRPWRIVLFGSRARGRATERSDYDFYVEVEASGHDALREEHDRIRVALRGGGAYVDVKVEPRGALEQRRDDPGTLEWDVAREGRVLYSDPAASTTIAPADRVRESSREPPRSLGEWLELAEKDRQHRDDLWTLDREYWAQICWLSHQTAEKHLKALLVSRWVRPERTHELDILLGQLERSGLPLPGIRAECELLTKHAVSARYAAGLLLRKPDARLATDAADRIITAAHGHLPAR